MLIQVHLEHQQSAQVLDECATLVICPFLPAPAVFLLLRGC